MEAYIIQTLGIALGAVATYACRQLYKYLKEKLYMGAENEKLKHALSQLEIFTVQVVTELLQNVVEGNKKAGTFDAAAQKKVKKAAVLKVKTRMTTKAKEYIEKEIATDGETLEGVISSSIEHAVRALK